MPKQTFISVSAETRERLTQFKDKWFEVKNDSELINDMIDELEVYFGQDNKEES